MKRKMRNWEDKLQWFAVIILASLALACIFSGCSSMSIAKQKKFAMLVGQQIEFVGNEVIAKCNDGTIKEDDCIFMANLINLALDSQNAYTRALLAMQNGTGSQEQVQKALETLQDDIANLVSGAISLGIKTRPRENGD